MKKIKFLGIVAAAAIVGTMAFVACDSGTTQMQRYYRNQFPGSLNATAAGNMQIIYRVTPPNTLVVNVSAANLDVTNAREGFELHFTTNFALFTRDMTDDEATDAVTRVAVVSGLPRGISAAGSIDISNSGWGNGYFTLTVNTTQPGLAAGASRTVLATVALPNARPDNFTVITTRPGID